MIFKRRKLCDVIHKETGLTFEVFCVDCFVEQFCTGETLPSFVFYARTYETTTGQKALKYRQGIWIIVTESNNWYMEELK